MNKARVIIFSIIIAGVFMNVAPANAAPFSILPSRGLVPDCERTSENFGTFQNDGSTGQPTNRPCTLRDFFQMLFNLTEWFLAILGASAFLLFFYGGLLFVISFGETKRVKEGRDIMVNTVLGIIVILGAYTAVKVLAAAFGVAGKLPP